MTRHLSPEDFIDALEGRRAAAELPHLGECDACRARLGDLHAAWLAAAAVDVPEPSPLFWDHLSARVRDAIAAEPVPARRWWLVPGSWRAASLTAALAAAVAVLVAVGVRPPSTPSSTVASQVAASDAVSPSRAAEDPFTIENDEPLALVADLASELDWDSAAEFGFTSRDGADRAIAEMSEAERAELERILTDALEHGA